MRKIKTGDTVQVMRGKDAGKKGEVTSIIETEKELKVIVSGVNIVKKSRKPNPTLGVSGGIIEMEKPISISNVMIIDPKTNKPTRVGFEIDKKTGKKFRIAKKSGEKLDK